MPGTDAIGIGGAVQPPQDMTAGQAVVHKGYRLVFRARARRAELDQFAPVDQPLDARARHRYAEASSSSLVGSRLVGASGAGSVASTVLSHGRRTGIMEASGWLN